MRYKLFILVLLLIGYRVYADYNPTPLPQLIVKSELILEGEIVSLDSLTFTLKISTWIKGDSTLKSIKIQKFKDWECANRISQYRKGQKEIVFISQNKKTQKWITLGAGNEGEFLIQNDSITYKDIFWNSESACTHLDYCGHMICVWKYSLNICIDTILFYKEKFPKLKKEFQNNTKITNRLENNEAYSRMIYETQSLNFLMILMGINE